MAEPVAIGAAGELVAAALETAGLYTVGNIIESAAPALKSLGFFVYVWCAVAALTSFALFGDTRRVIYFVVGPALFYWSFQAVRPVTAVRLRVGQRIDAQGEARIRSTITESFGGANTPANTNVPFIMVAFDNMVSEVTQQIVSLLLDTTNKQDLKAAARDRILSRILLQGGDKAPYYELVALSLVGNCAKQVSLAREIGTPRLSGAPAGSAAATELATKQAELARLAPYRVPLSASVTQYAIDLGYAEQTSATCAEIWSYTKTASIKAAEDMLATSDVNSAQYGLTAAELTEVRTAVLTKLNSGATGSADITRATEIVAALILKNTVDESSHAKMMTQMSSRREFRPEMKDRILGNIAGHEANGSRLLVTYFSATIPYIQGTILFCLSVIFPFFTIFLLMPSRFSSFFVWFYLWAWVKSWDVGFAVVSQLKDILWILVPHVGEVRGYQGLASLNWDDPSSVFNVIYANDPSGNLNTYYTVISIFTLAVPVITAQFCLGASEIYQSLAGGFLFRANQIQSRKVTGSKVREGVAVRREIGENRIKAELAGAEHAQQNPGNIEGTNIGRNTVGDGTMQRHMVASAKIAGYQYNFGEENRNNLAYLGVLHGRQESYALGQHTGVVDAELHYKNEQMAGRRPGEFLSPKLSQDQDVNYNLNKGVGAKAGQPTDANSGEGGQ